jgi:hypothetical protein
MNPCPFRGFFPGYLKFITTQTNMLQRRQDNTIFVFTYSSKQGC